MKVIDKNNIKFELKKKDIVDVEYYCFSSNFKCPIIIINCSENKKIEVQFANQFGDIFRFCKKNKIAFNCR